MTRWQSKHAIARASATTLSRLLLASVLAATMPVATVQAKPPPAAEQKQRMSAQEAASRARAQHGGKVLKVSRDKDGYRVKLLLDSGRVITVNIRD